jgi:hypothetical protein
LSCFRFLLLKYTNNRKVKKLYYNNCNVFASFCLSISKTTKFKEIDITTIVMFSDPFKYIKTIAFKENIHYNNCHVFASFCLSISKSTTFMESLYYTENMLHFCFTLISETFLAATNIRRVSLEILAEMCVSFPINILCFWPKF